MMSTWFRDDANPQLNCRGEADRLEISQAQLRSMTLKQVDQFLIGKTLRSGRTWPLVQMSGRFRLPCLAEESIALLSIGKSPGSFPRMKISLGIVAAIVLIAVSAVHLARAVSGIAVCGANQGSIDAKR